MSKTPEDSGFLHEHSKEIAVGSIAALGMVGLVFTVARQHLRDKEEQPAETEEPNDNS